MFKFAHKISSYVDELRIDFNLSKRKKNFRFKDKVLYLKDQTVLWKNYHRFWYKFLYVMNDELIYDYKHKQCLHREGGLPAIIRSNGDKHWYVNGKRHQEGGLPAIINSNGYQAWYLNGKLHREDGPAFIYPNGTKYWCLNGVQYTP